MKFKCCVLFVFILFTFFCNAQTSILYIGNSLTYVNDLPQTFKKLCDINGKYLENKVVAYPGYSLYKHLTTVVVPTDNPNLVYTKRINNNDTIISEAIKQLKSRKWDYIYLQDREVDEDSLEYSILQIRKLAPESKIMIFENYMYDSRWSKKYDHRKKRLNIKKFKRLANLINAEVIPVSYCFEKIKKNHSPDLLYDETMHPTNYGTIIIAILLYKNIFKHEKFNFNSETFKITDDEWEILKKIVIKG